MSIGSRIAAISGRRVALGGGALLMSGIVVMAGASSSSASTGLPKTIAFRAISDLTGPAGIYGQYEQQGADLAVHDLNASHYLGSSKLSISFGDAAGSNATAASLASEAVGKYPVLLGPIDSSEAIVVGPILKKAKQPTVYIEAGGPGVLIAPNIVRVTPVQSGQLPATMKYLQSKHVKTVAALYDGDFASLAGLASEVGSTAHKYGMTYSGGVATLLTDTDIAPAISKLLALHTDAVAIFVAGAQNSEAATQIAQAGYKGTVVAEQSAVTALSAAGSGANGWTWSTDWNPPGTNKQSAAFTKEFTAKYGTAPTLYSAEGYLAVYYGAAAVKDAGSVQQSKINAKLLAPGVGSGLADLFGHTTVAKDGQGTSPTSLVQWSNGKARIIPTP